MLGGDLTGSGERRGTLWKLGGEMAAPSPAFRAGRGEILPAEPAAEEQLVELPKWQEQFSILKLYEEDL